MVDLYFTLIGILGCLVGIIYLIFPKVRSKFLLVVPGLNKNFSKPEFFPTAEKCLGFERAQKIGWWLGILILLVGLGFIIYGIFS